MLPRRIPSKPVDLNDVFDDARKNLRVRIEEHGADITAEELPIGEGDAGPLRRAFQNLLDNAIECRGDGARRVRVSAEPDRSSSGDESSTRTV